jgi:hypothetical protein
MNFKKRNEKRRSKIKETGREKNMLRLEGKKKTGCVRKENNNVCVLFCFEAKRGKCEAK